VESEIAELLKKVSEGDEVALRELTPLVYAELRRIAQSQMRRHRLDNSSEPSSVVHETYLRLVRGLPVPFRDRAHFLGIMAHIMRQVLVDHARTRKAQKRGWGLKVDVPGKESHSRENSVNVLALNEALELLGRRDKDLVRLVELRFFAGLSSDEIAGVTGQSVHAVRHRLQYAKSCLRKHLES
jgi:RNA polymerase sigma factor (TIGR02999 family)